MLLKALLFVYWTGFVAALTWNESQEVQYESSHHLENLFIAVLWPVSVPFSIIYYTSR